MALTPKPFAIDNKMRKRKFAPSPSVTTDVDMNQESDAIVYGIEEIARRLGGVRENSSTVVNGMTLTKTTPTNYRLDVDIELQGSVVVGGSNYFYVHHRSVRFRVPEYSNATNVVNSPSANLLPKYAVWLKAKRQYVSFGSDPVEAGVTGPGFPSPLSSSEPEVWSDETCVDIVNNVFPVLTGGFEYICPIFTLGYEDIAYTGNAVGYTPYLVYDAPDLTDFVTFERGMVNGGNSAVNLFGTDGRQWLKIKELDNKVTVLMTNYLQYEITAPALDDILLYTSVAGINKFRNTQANPLIEDRFHQINKRYVFPNQDLGAGQYYTLTPNHYRLVIGPDNMSVEMEAPEDTVIDDIIQLYIPAVGLFPAFEIPVPTGSVIFMNIKMEAGGAIPSGWGTNITNLAVSTGSAFINPGVHQKYIMYKTATTWLIMSCPEHMVESMNTLNNSINILNAIVANPKPLYVYKASGALTTGTNVKVVFPSEVFDPNNAYDSVTTGDYVCPKAGYYKMRVSGTMNITAAGTWNIGLHIWKNVTNAGTLDKASLVNYTGSSALVEYQGEVIIPCALNDAISFYFMLDASATINVTDAKMFIEYVSPL